MFVTEISNCFGGRKIIFMHQFWNIDAVFCICNCCKMQDYIAISYDVFNLFISAVNFMKDKALMFFEPIKEQYLCEDILSITQRSEISNSFRKLVMRCEPMCPRPPVMQTFIVFSCLNLCQRQFERIMFAIAMLTAL